MAAMLVRPLARDPRIALAVAFAVAAAWFGLRAVRALVRSDGGAAVRSSVQQFATSLCMAFMLAVGTGAPSVVRELRPGATMAGMGPGAIAVVSLPLTALLFAMVLLGYVAWDLGELTSLATTLRREPASTVPRAPTAPRLTLWCQIVMGATTGYMLVSMA